jgi:phosphotransferase system  glucose/maltose/N-acetylglucosamine-specific IIC component
LNAVFNLVISVAAMLAVIMIIYHGIQYMTQEAVGEKKDAMLGIRSTIFGLILLLLSWVILHVIDPNITNLDALKSELGGAPAANSAGTSQTFSFENQQSSDWDAACVSKGGAVHLTCATGPYKGESISQCGSTSSGIIHSCVK